MSNGHTALAAGDLNYAGPRQIRIPSPQIIATNSGGGEGSATVQIYMPIPSSRLRSKLSVFFVPTSGPPPSLVGSAFIWVSAQEEDYKGIGGGGGGRHIVTDLEGSEATPFAIGSTAPNSNADVEGYAREFVTAADWIGAQLTINALGVPGTWVAQFRTEPAFTPFLWEEWDEIRRLFLPQVQGRGTL